MAEEYKNFKIASQPGYMMKEIKAIGRGSVPAPLRGLYTTSREAKLAIDRHLGNKEKTRAKTESAN